MAESTIWWVLAGTIVAIELATGTFYLLMLGIGMAAAAIAAHLGLPVTGQILMAAAVGGGAVAIWHLQIERKPKALLANANPDVHIDIGELVFVEQWNADGTASVKYRGANWTAILATSTSTSMSTSTSTFKPPLIDEIGQFRIKELIGNRLVIEKI